MYYAWTKNASIYHMCKIEHDFPSHWYEPICDATRDNINVIGLQPPKSMRMCEDCKKVKEQGE